VKFRLYAVLKSSPGTLSMFLLKSNFALAPCSAASSDLNYGEKVVGIEIAETKEEYKLCI